MHALAPTMPADLRALLEPLGMKANGERPRTERVLEQLLDVHRCVALGRVLDQPLRAQPGDLEARLALREAQLARLRLLEADLVSGLRELRAQIDQRFDNAFGSGRGAPDAAALHELLGKHGAGQISARYVKVVDGVLEQLLKELAWRHNDLQKVLQQGDAALLRLAALDRVLDGVFRSELELCRVQVEASLGAALEGQLAAATAALPSGASSEALRSWFAPRGCIGRFFRDARRLCHALLDLEWSALMGLLQSAAQLELEKAEP